MPILCSCRKLFKFLCGPTQCERGIEHLVCILIENLSLSTNYMYLALIFYQSVMLHNSHIIDLSIIITVWLMMTSLRCAIRIIICSYKCFYICSSQPKKWLSLLHTYPLSKLVYLVVNSFYQYVRLEFDSAGACFTFLIKDENKCQKCLTRLSR